MKQQVKTNPYEKKKVTKKRITRKQWTIIGILLAVVAIFVFLRVFGPNNNEQLDPHAGHNHAEGEGHDDDTTTGKNQNNTTGNGHNADSETGVLNYRVYTNADKTYRVSVVNAKNEEVFQQDKLYNAPVKEDLSDEIFALGWATGTGPNDFAQIFCNKKTGAVSGEFFAPKGYDGVRVAYPSEDQTKIIVEDIFDKDNYHKEYTLEDAFRKDGEIVVGGKLHSDKKSVTVSYYSDEKGTVRQTTVKLYE